MDFSIKLIIYQIINFVILVGILGFLFNKFIRPFMKKRSEDIKNSFDQIAKQKIEVENLKKECVDQLDEIKKGARVEIEKAIAEGNRLKDDLKAAAEKDASLFMDKARKEIEQEKQKLLSDVRREVATLTMQATKQLIKKEVDEATNKKLVETFLSELDTTISKKN